MMTTLEKKNVWIVLVAVAYAICAQYAILNGSNLLMLCLPGFLISLFLFNSPVLCFWVILFTAMLSGLAVSYLPGMARLPWGISFLSLIMGTKLLLDFILNRLKFNQSHLNPIFLLFSLFVFESIITSIINGGSGKQLIISIKNNYQFYSVLLFFLLYPIPSLFYGRLNRAILILSICQPPIVLYQYFIIVPKLRWLTGNTGTSVLDAVNGSFGSTLQGGGTGMYTLFTCFILCSLLLAFGMNMISKKRYFILSLYIVFPMFMNETKAAFLFLIVGSLFVIYNGTDVSLNKKIVLFILSSLLIISMLWANLQTMGLKRDRELSNTFEYNLGNKGYDSFYLNRLTCLSFWFQKNRHDLISAMIGHGLDATEEGLSGLSGVGTVAKQYPMFGTGLTTVSKVLWENGVVGILLLLGSIVFGIRQSLIFSRFKHFSKMKRFLALSMSVGLFLTIPMFFYNSMFRTSQAANLFIVLMLSVAIKFSCELNQRQKNTIAHGIFNTRKLFE